MSEPYPDHMLYLVTFPDDKANFYVELNDKLDALYESKNIDVNKIVSCPDFKLNKIYCDIYLKTDDSKMPVKAKITKLFPSNWDGRKKFYNLLDEQKSSLAIGGKKKRRSYKNTRKHKNSKTKRSKFHKTRKNRHHKK